MEAPVIISLIILLVGVVANMVMLAFSYGKVSQKVTDNTKIIEGLQNGKHGVMPECQQQFNQINTSIGQVHGEIGELKGKLDTLILMSSPTKKES